MDKVYLLKYTVPYEFNEADVFFDLNNLAEKLIENGFIYFKNDAYFNNNDKSLMDDYYEVYVYTPHSKRLLENNIIYDHKTKQKKDGVKNNIRSLILTQYSAKDIYSIKIEFNYEMLHKIKIIRTKDSNIDKKSIKEFVSYHVSPVLLDIEVEVE